MDHQIKVVDATTIECGPITWVRKDQGGVETWEATVPDNLPGCVYVVKNYGGTPSAGDPFTGWRLVSGGPFGERWSDRDNAISGGTEQVAKRWIAETTKLLNEAMRARKALNDLIDKIR